MERDSERGEGWSDDEFLDNKRNFNLTNEQSASMNAYITDLFLLVIMGATQNQIQIICRMDMMKSYFSIIHLH